MSDRLQCLLLLKSDPESRPQGYTLVNSMWDSNDVVRMLSATAPGVTHDQINPPQNAKFDLIEVWLHFAIFAQNAAAERYVPRLFVNEYDLDIVRRLFPSGSNINFITRFRIDNKCPLLRRFHALTDGNLKSIEKLLLAGADIKWRRPKGGTTLAHFAAEKGSAPLIALLSRCGVDLSGGGNENAMPLHIAVQKGNTETLKALLDSGADIAGKATDGSSAMHVATKAGSLEIVRLLIEKGASVDAKTAKGWTSLHLAVDTNNSEIVSLLLEHGADLESRIETGADVVGATPLLIALRKNRWSIAKQLVAKGASLDAQCRKGRNAFYFAVAAQDPDFIEYLFNRHPAPDVTSPGNKKAFRLAFQINKDEDSSESDDDTKTNAFLYSSERSVLQTMIELGFSVDISDVDQPDVLFGAIYKGHFEIVQKLLVLGANVHQKRMYLKTKMTPIHVACRHADEKMVQLLLDHGANPGALRGGSHLNTPIADAVEWQNVEVVKLLLANNMSVRDRPDFLHSATKRSLHELMELLLENGVPVNGEPHSNSGEPPILIAVRQGDGKAADILMKYGARLNFKDVSFKWFENYKYFKFLTAFLAHGFAINFDAAALTMIHMLLNQYDLDFEDNRFEGYLSLVGFFQGPQKNVNMCIKSIGQFIMKMKVAGKVVVQDIPSGVPADISKSLNLEQVQRESEKELYLMRSSTISGTGITLFDVLTKSSNLVARYTRNENIRNELGAHKFASEFPQYGSILECQFQRGNWRRELLDKGIKTLNSLNRRFRALPFDLKEDIMGLLDNQDLLTLQKCCRAK